MSQSDINDLVQNLFRDLEISADETSQAPHASVAEELGTMVSQNSEDISSFFDVSVFAASMGDWTYALECIDRYVSNELTSQIPLAWKLRCLVELGQFSEALALADAHEWPQFLRIHVKYLSGLSYLNLKMDLRAQKDFEWVERQDSGYREVARLLGKV